MSANYCKQKREREREREVLAMHNCISRHDDDDAWWICEARALLLVTRLLRGGTYVLDQVLLPA